jgi:transposase
MHEQLGQHRHLTLQLLWEEYRPAHPEGYRYSWFCQRYQHWRRHLDVVLRQEHKAGEKMFVDWAGATIPVCDATTGQASPASLFVSVVEASSYTYAEATRDQQMEAWIQAHIHALKFYDGAPTLAVPDNTKTAVTRACRYDPDPITSLESRPKSSGISRSALMWISFGLVGWKVWVIGCGFRTLSVCRRGRCVRAPCAGRLRPARRDWRSGFG